MDGSAAPKRGTLSMTPDSSSSPAANTAAPDRHTAINQQHHAQGSRTLSANAANSANVSNLAAVSAPILPQVATIAAAPMRGLVPTMAMSLDSWKGGLGQFQQLLDDLSSSLDRERQDLKDQREGLEHDRRLFEAECLRVQHQLHGNEQVVLNVGGSKFTTLIGTLRNAPSPSLFNAMFSGRHAIKTDETGCYFFDRDGRHFHDILNFLRDGVLNYPLDGCDFKYLLELRAEADYYGLVGLVQQIDRFPYGLVRVQRASTLNLDDSWMYEDGQDEVVFTVGSPCHLLGVGLCGTEGGITVELDVYEVEPADFSAEVCTLQSAAQSFTKADGQIVRMLFPAPAMLHPGKYYMLSALIKGSESYCCEDGLETCIAGGVKVSFQSWESPNGTNEQRGQFPEIYVRPV